MKFVCAEGGIPMELELYVANPAGNITALVTTPVLPEDYVALAQKIIQSPLVEPTTGRAIEQVGYIQKMEEGQVHLEMMGGEFCGNATRSAALLGASSSQHQVVQVQCSGHSAPLPVTLHLEEGTSFVEMPLPLSWEEISCGAFGRLGLVTFPGIAHLIALGIPPSEEDFYAIQKYLPCHHTFHALGIMFYHQEKMTPYVEVTATQTLVVEGSCGSGTTALALWRSHLAGSTNQTHHIQQPSGELTAQVVFQQQKLTSLSMGGQVTLGEKIRLELQ